MSRRALSTGLAARTTSVLVAAVALVGNPVHAQDPALTPEGRRLSQLFSGLDRDRPVQVITPSFFVEDAFVASVGADHVELSQAGTNVDIGFGDIRGVSVQKTHWLQGTLWGAGAGILVGGVAGLMVASWDCRTPEGCTDLEQRGMVRWATVFGIGGAIGGFMIGRNAVYWSAVFP